jgi:hypothetical protein
MAKMSARDPPDSAPAATGFGPARNRSESVAFTPGSRVNATASDSSDRTSEPAACASEPTDSTRPSPTSTQALTGGAPSPLASARLLLGRASSATASRSCNAHRFARPPARPSACAAFGTVLDFFILDRPKLGSVGSLTTSMQDNRAARRPAIVPAHTVERSSLYGREVT